VALQESKASMSSAIEWLQNSNRKLKERAEREQARPWLQRSAARSVFGNRSSAFYCAARFALRR
jgi:hypothetical protein